MKINVKINISTMIKSILFVLDFSKDPSDIHLTINLLKIVVTNQKP
jgi:hypothetical protein